MIVAAYSIYVAYVTVRIHIHVFVQIASAVPRAILPSEIQLNPITFDLSDDCRR